MGDGAHRPAQTRGPGTDPVEGHEAQDAEGQDVKGRRAGGVRPARGTQEGEGAEARQEGDEVLAKNAKRTEVMVTEYGLQYEVLKEGTGTRPTATETVEVHYHGMLLDGTVFDSSVDRGETIEFPLNRVIPGWTEGVQLMKEGAKYRFYIPFDLAYGPRGSAPKIPPYAALIFEVELFKVK